MSNVRFLTILLAIFAFSAVADHKVATDGSPNMFSVYNPQLHQRMLRTPKPGPLIFRNR